ncbi:WXG100 family type VII secretion target [Amycolatopsis ultiminotia]|uniref:WXG100 family type VII secretion target n=1 Tax=Amycolatopsis ultiminotia TaxID=543629 RepID=A0ABP6VMF3_9PSEU
MTPPAAQNSGRLGDSIIAPLQPPADVHLDDTSDAMIKSLSGFRDQMTGKLGEVYVKWIQHPSRNLGTQFAAPYGRGDEENRLLNELGGFGFGHLWGAQGRAANLGKAAKAAQDDAGQAKQAVAASWQGKAADSAAEKLDDFAKAAGDYGGAVNGFSQLLQQLWHTVRQPIVDLAKLPEDAGQSPKQFLDAHSPDDCDGQSMFIDRLNDAIKWGRRKNHAEVANSEDGGTGPISPQDLRDASLGVDLDTDYYSRWANDFCNQMDEYCVAYSNAMNTYRQYIRNAHTAATNALRAFTDGLDVPTDPFGGLHFGAGGDAGGQTKSSSSGGDHGNGAGGSPSANAGGSSAPSPASAAPQQAVPAPAPAAPAATTPAAADPNANPVTHQPLETDPGTGQPYPIDPRTGQAVKPDTEQPETMTVQQGDHKLSLTEPGDDGRMGITVDDGSGHPKDFQLDFGDHQDGAQAGADPAAQQPGSGQPAQVPGQPDAGPGQQADSPGHSAHAPDSPGQPDQATGAHAAPGSPDQPGSDTAPKYEPGPDGKIHIEDGGLKIIAERPQGPDGPTVVTVDDGSGEPVKYTLGDDHGTQLSPDASGPAQTSTPDSAAHPGQSMPDAAQQPGQGVPDGAQQPGQGVPDAAQHSPAEGVQQAPAAAQYEQPDVPVAHSAEATVDTSGADDATTAQSVINPLDSDSGIGHPADNPLGAAPSGEHTSGGGAAGDSSVAELGTAPPGSDHGQQQAPSAMGMMGGGLGSAPSGGGDQERSTNPYRAPGGLFDAGSSGRRISGSLDDEGSQGTR